MSIVLYHGGAAANSLKSLLPLFEKNVDFKSHLMRLIDFEQHEPWFVKLNPRGQVPVLVHHDYVLDESTLINEYVDDTFPGLPLKPSDAYGRHQMRIWTKFVDEYFCPALSFLGWHAMIRNATAHLSKEELALKVKTYVPRLYIHAAAIGTDPDQRNYVVSNRRLEEAGFAARRSLDDGIVELIKGYRMLGRSPFGNV